MHSDDIEALVPRGDRIIAIGRCAYRQRVSRKTVATRLVDIIRVRGGKIEELVDTAAMRRGEE